MAPFLRSAVVHLELHTGDAAAAGAQLAQLCGWRAQSIPAGDRSYLALALGSGLGGGIVECTTRRPLWLPYVEVPSVQSATERAREAGATVLLEPREARGGWRSVVASPTSGEIAFWQPR
jgi:predicted enzyme related to lactoylglutathione lyase